MLEKLFMFIGGSLIGIVVWGSIVIFALSGCIAPNYIGTYDKSDYCKDEYILVNGNFVLVITCGSKVISVNCITCD